MSDSPDEASPNPSGNHLPATQDTMRLPANVLFGSIAEAPFEERKGLYREARDGVYLGFVDNVLAMPEESLVEERVAALEFVGSALDAFLPKGHRDFYFFGAEPSQLSHALNTAQLAIRLEQVRSQGYRLATSRGSLSYEFSKFNHLDEAFPPRPLGKTDDNRWQWQSSKIYKAKDTCLLFINPERLPKETLALEISRNVSENMTEADLLRAAQIYTEASIFQLLEDRHQSGDAIDKEAAALAALRTPDNIRQLTDETMLAELNKLEIRLRATAIARIGMPKYGEPKSLVEHGEFVFDPANCDEAGIPNGLTAEEAEKVRERHLKNIDYMAKNARDEDSRPAYAEMLAKQQPQLPVPQE